MRDEGPGIPEGRLAAAEADGQARGGAVDARAGRATSGGTITCDTGPGRGTEWIIRVPRAGGGHDGHEHREITVMVVDDHPIWREGVARDLTERGLRVVATAADADAAVRIAHATRPRVVLMDLNLGATSGVAAIEGILDQAARTRRSWCCRRAASTPTCWRR